MKLFKFLIFIVVVFSILNFVLSKFISYYKPENINIVYKYSYEYDLEPELVLALIHAESKFEQSAISSKGASGYMQIMEGTAYWAAENIGLEDFEYDDIFNAETNIQLGCWYIRNLINQFGDINTAIVAYNAGSGNVSRWLKEQRTTKINEDNIPFKESDDYLKRVLFNYKVYEFYLKYVGE